MFYRRSSAAHFSLAIVRQPQHAEHGPPMNADKNQIAGGTGEQFWSGIKGASKCSDLTYGRFVPL
jgi:hypothetical protein